MNRNSKILFKALIDRSSHKEALLTYLKTEEADEINRLPSYPLFSLPHFLAVKMPLAEYHYSWLLPKIKKLSKENQTLFLSLFSKEEAEKLQKLLSTSLPYLPLPPLLQYPLAKHFAKNLDLEESLPKECIPESDLLPLLTLNKEQLLRLIDLLGIYDLATDLPQIVDKTLLSKIASSLTEEQRKFLQYATKQSIRYLPKRMNLQEIDKNPATLNRLLHRRGLERLAGALAQEEKEFLAHLFHTLDTGRASLLEKIRKENRDQGLVKFFKRQVLHLVQQIRL